MIIKLKVLATTFSASSLLLLALCLGSQNLNDRHSLDFGIAKTAPLPSGFIIGISLITGIINGGAITSIFINEEFNE